MRRQFAPRPVGAASASCWGAVLFCRQAARYVRKSRLAGAAIGDGRMENRRSTASNTKTCWPAAAARCFAEGPQLPLPPMLMFDRISEIAEAGGEHGKGLVRAELEVKPDLWFFPCHFKGDPVMPGCLGLDALWQLLGFFLGWLGSSGKRPRARPGRGQVLRPGAADHEERRLRHRHQAGDALQARARHRRRLALGRRHGDLPGARSQGRAVPRHRALQPAAGACDRAARLRAKMRTRQA